MATTLTIKGQVTIPKNIRDALKLKPGTRLEFAVNAQGDVVLHQAGAKASQRPSRFGQAHGKAQVAWRTDDPMALLRGND